MPVVSSLCIHPRQINLPKISGVEIMDWGTSSFATTQLDNTNDQTLCVQFPEDSSLYLRKLECVISDMDGGSALTLNIGIGDSDGVIDTLLISASTAGQSGADDYEDSGTLTPPVSVNGKYIVVDVGTAASTAVAGTIQFIPHYVSLSGNRTP